MLVLAAALTANAADVEQDLAWSITLDGKPVGKRTATVKWFTDDDGDVRRMIETWTEIDATLIGVQYTVKERLTAMCGKTAGSFQTVIDVSGDNSQIQARRAATAWSVTVNHGGKEYSRDWATTAIDMSTADLLDPDSRVSLGSFTNARILAAETGDILEGPVTRLGAGQIEVSGSQVPVEGYAWTVEGVESRFWYTSDGYLVRWETGAIGHKLSGTLTDPPPTGTDDAPVQSQSTVTEIPL
jgi:hypothetical protein